jgi:hypothetical protein
VVAKVSGKPQLRKTRRICDLTLRQKKREKWTEVTPDRFGVSVFVNFCINISDEDDDEKTTKTITIYNKSNKRVTKPNAVICSTRQFALATLCIIVVSL